MLFAYGERVCAGSGVRTAWWRAPSFVLTTLIALSFITSALLSRASPGHAFYAMPSRLWQLAVGALLYEWQRSRRPALWFTSSVRLALVDATGALQLVLGLVLADGRGGGFPVPWALVPVGATLCFIAAGSAQPCHVELGAGLKLRLPLLNAGDRH